MQRSASATASAHVVHRNERRGDVSLRLRREQFVHPVVVRGCHRQIQVDLRPVADAQEGVGEHHFGVHTVEQLLLRSHRQIAAAGRVVAELLGAQLVVHLDRRWRHDDVASHQRQRDVSVFAAFHPRFRGTTERFGNACPHFRCFVDVTVRRDDRFVHGREFGKGFA
jgi:hypothetical protein